VGSENVIFFVYVIYGWAMNKDCHVPWWAMKDVPGLCPSFSFGPYKSNSKCAEQGANAS